MAAAANTVKHKQVIALQACLIKQLIFSRKFTPLLQLVYASVLEVK